MSKGLISLLVFIGLVGAGTLIYVFPSASNQGYAPEQPIPFSHKLHAGQMKIDCKYCHVGVDKSPHASIPSVNVCMNCHKVVKTDSPHIQKLTAHYNAGKPVEWVRIHELPDHAHFNHKRHVTKGVKCETCHGPIQEMDKVYQYSPLTMGWCLECHRGQTTPNYVKKLVDPENKHPDDIAPINCATCHY